MPSWLLAFVFAIGVTAWAYSKLARANGNANPRSNMILALTGGVVVFLVVFSLMKLVLNF